MSAKLVVGARDDGRGRVEERNSVTAYVVATATSHKGRSLHGWRAGVAARSDASEEGIAFLLFEPFYDFGHVLGAGAGAEEEGVVGFNQDHIVDA
jgi:hypothetical protein